MSLTVFSCCLCHDLFPNGLALLAGTERSLLAGRFLKGKTINNNNNIRIGGDPVIKNDIRRVQRHGKGSLTITLPKDWCQANDIGEGTAMRMTEEVAGLLLTKVI